MHNPEKEIVSNSIDIKIYWKENQDFINNNPQILKLTESFSNLSKKNISISSDIIEKSILYSKTNKELKKLKIKIV
jgi:hypothetical protein